MEELRSFALFITALAVWYYNTASWIVNSYQKYYVTEFFMSLGSPISTTDLNAEQM